MRYSLRVEVSLKPMHNDPEGETTGHLLRELGYSVETVNISKVYSMTIKARSKDEVKTKAEEMCKRLLANPTKDDYAVAIEEVR